MLRRLRGGRRRGGLLSWGICIAGGLAGGTSSRWWCTGGRWGWGGGGVWGRWSWIAGRLGGGEGGGGRGGGGRRGGGGDGWGYVRGGGAGGGHFVKMVHNGIEYGMMAAYAEGLGVLKAANIGKHTAEIDAETTPLRDPEHYQYDFNLPDVTEVWRRGSVIASWLLDLTASALIEEPELS